MEKNEKHLPQDGYDLSALAEAMLMAEKRLPETLPEDLQTLRQMLEDAVKGEDGTEAPVPIPPAYGKIVIPVETDGTEKDAAVLRQDKTVAFPTPLTALSPRQAGEFVVVPQVVGQGGNT